jgi:uncharacterized protein YqeY
VPHDEEDGHDADHDRERADQEERGHSWPDYGRLPRGGANATLVGATGGADRIFGPAAYVTIAAVALYDRLQAELIDARRRRDGVALDTLQLLKSELVKASKDSAAGGKIDDDLLVRVVRKEVKRREEAIDVYRKAGREETARREEAEMALLRTYLPAAMSVDQVEAEVRKIIDELKPEGPNAFGVVMKTATARLAGKAEGAQIAAAARKLLAA